MLKLKLQYFVHLMWRTDSLENSLMLGKTEGRRRRGWDGWMASMTQWTWVWVSLGRWWRTGKPDMLQFMGLQRIRHNWATEQQQNGYMKMTQTLFLLWRRSQFSQERRIPRVKIEVNINAALEASERCHENSDKTVMFLGKLGRLPGQGGIWVFQTKSWKIILSSLSQGIERAVHLCGWIVGCMGIA